MKLKPKMLLSLLVPVIILTGLLSFYAYYTAKDALKNQIEQTNTFKLATYSAQFNETLARQEALATNLAAHFSERDLTEPEIRTLIDNAKKSNAQIKNIMVAFNDKRFIDTDKWVPPADYDARTRAWYKKIIAGNTIIYSDVYTDANTKKLLVCFGEKIVLNGKPAGVIAIEIDLDNLLKQIASMTTAKTGYTFIVDSNGAFLSHPEFSPSENITVVKNGALADFYKNLQANPEAAIVLTVNGQEIIYNSKPIGKTGWLLFSATPSAELYESLNGMRLIFGLGGFVVILLLTGIILWLTLNITRPLQKMMELAKQLSSGDFSDHNEEISSHDEIGELAAALYAMQKALQELIRKVSSSADQLAASSEQFTSSAEQSAQAANQIAVSITEVASGANKQLHAVEKTTSAIEKMAGSIQQLSTMTKQGANASAQSAQSANSGNTIINRAIEQMRNVEKTVNTSANSVENLGERSSEIGQIVDTISAIASQTNLLALNAAIEAARAGSQGRGFAVVAEEVRKLAEQSQNAAHHIAELIEKIRLETTDAVAAMHSGRQEVHAGTELVNEAGQTFETIHHMIDTVNEQFTSAYKAIEALSQGNNEIVFSIEEINTISRGTSTESENVSAATEEQSASMHELSSASQALAKLAQELQHAVSIFKV